MHARILGGTGAVVEESAPAATESKISTSGEVDGAVSGGIAPLELEERGGDTEEGMRRPVRKVSLCEVHLFPHLLLAHLLSSFR